MDKRFIFLSVVLFAIATASLFGSWHFADMQKDGSGEMEGCPLAGMAALCQMSAMEHIMKWQSMFSGLPHENNQLSLVNTLFVLAVFLFSTVLWPRGQDRANKEIYIQRTGELPETNYLQSAFSRGILNAKVYETAIQ